MAVTNRNKLLAFCGLLVFGAIFLYGLGAILTPFVVAALLAYLGDPLVDRLERLKLGRTLAVLIVFLVLSLSVVVLLLLFGPLLIEQLHELIKKLPNWIDRIADFSLPYLKEWGVLGQGELNQEAIKNAFSNYWKEGGNLALNAIQKIGSSSAALLVFMSNMILIPVLTFYLLRDWDIIVDKLAQLLPRSSKNTVVGIVAECDEVLSSFLRGQLIVMLSLGVIYSLGLTIVGLDLALLIGTLAGLFSIIPYMGFAVGIVAALIAAWMQFHSFLPLVYVSLVFGIGQSLEGMLLTPNLVGDKIGLHPVAVIFALMAGAHLGGFVGLLLALPLAAMLMVLVRYFLKQYKQSYLYTEDQHTSDTGTTGDESLIAEIQIDQPRIGSGSEVDSVFDETIWMKEVD